MCSYSNCEVSSAALFPPSLTVPRPRTSAPHSAFAATQHFVAHRPLEHPIHLASFFRPAAALVHGVCGIVRVWWAVVASRRGFFPNPVELHDKASMFTQQLREMEVYLAMLPGVPCAQVSDQSPVSAVSRRLLQRATVLLLISLGFTFGAPSAAATRLVCISSLSNAMRSIGGIAAMTFTAVYEIVL